MMTRVIRSLLFSSLVLAALPCSVRADDTEFRDFRILVDGKESGFSQMTITRKSDGSMNMTGTAAVRISHVLFSYNFNSQASEWWKDGQLVNMKTTTTENGKRIEVAASAQPGGMQLVVNNKAKATQPDIWPSSFWKLPDAKYHNKEIPILEVDTGREYIGRLQYVATEEMPVVGKTEKCYHFRVTSSSTPIDLWFDRYYLVVRQDFIDTGRRVSVQLIKIRH